MKNLVNRVQLIGNLGSDPERKDLASGTALVRFPLATNAFYRNKEGEKIQETTWHSLVAWGVLADRLEAALRKGMEVAVSGKIRNRSYDDANGQRRFVSEIIVDDFYRITRANREELPVVTMAAKDNLPF